MRFSIVLIIFFSSLVKAEFKAFEQSHKDIAGDIDHSFHTCNSPQTDILNTSFKREQIHGEVFYSAIFETKQNIQLNDIYKEYYIWIDYNPGKRKGYQPYNPYSVAWTGFYADYRLFFSNNESEKKTAIQNCSLSDCSIDLALYNSWFIDVKVVDNKVTITWPEKLTPELAAATKIRFAFTSYYGLYQCHGEDDSPQWGRPAFEINLAPGKQSTPPKVIRLDFRSFYMSFI